MSTTPVPEPSRQTRRQRLYSAESSSSAVPSDPFLNTCGEKRGVGEVRWEEMGRGRRGGRKGQGRDMIGGGGKGKREGKEEEERKKRCRVVVRER